MIDRSAMLYHARKRRLSRRDPSLDLRPSFQVGGISEATIQTTTLLGGGVRGREVTFKTSIRITENSGVHRGLVFEIGGTTRGVALWVDDNEIGFHAGPDGVLDGGATALWDYGSELEVGREFHLVASVRPELGLVRLWDKGQELARGAAVADMGNWAGTNFGSFGAAVASNCVSDVPGTSQIAPDGFDVTSPLLVYCKQRPRHFS